MSTMTEPTTEAKIELLVRSVLEAVDARLDAVRHEIAAFSSDVEQRHHHLLESMAALDARITELAARPAGTTDARVIAQLSGELDRLAMRVDSLALRGQAPAPAETPVVAPRVPTAEAPHAIAEPTAVTTGTHQITREELDEISRPIVTRITTQVPIVPDPTGHHEPLEHLPLTVPPLATPHFAAPQSTAADDTNAATADPAGTDAPAAADDAIDLDQLTSLLNARLGSLTLPTRHD